MTANARAGEVGERRRMYLCPENCEVRDSRWRIKIDASDDPVSVRVVHQKHGDFYDWPDAAYGGGDCLGGACPAADRAYTMQAESNFQTRSAALRAGHDFLRRFGAGEVEYLEWDVVSQSMLVTAFHTRREKWWKHEADTPDPLAPFYVEPHP